ncbi:Dot6p [Saccharomyces cerevisiae]|nr:Dot6p [Saccharomyces cerevisiae]
MNRTPNSKNPQDIALLNNFRSEAITPRPKPSSTTTSITTENTNNMINHSSSTTTTTNNSPLPSINTIFKDML